ncbi:site-2 protease family protein [Candidatus Babeliales bacterium]|nr:site-2 protease family protein [Candidatus Babeliales bacterium]
MNNTLLAALNIAAIFLPSLILVLTFRGFFRALIAKLLGDRTAYNEGFMTLNPVAHIDLFGLLLIIFVLLIIGGLLPGFAHALLLIALIFMGVRWSYEVPIDTSNFKHKKGGLVLISLAGFIGNCVLALLFMYIRKYFPFGKLPFHAIDPIASLFVAVVDLSIFFGVFNLLPIPPFDGSILLSSLLKPSSYNILHKLEEYSLYILMFLFLFGGVFFVGISYLVGLLKSILLLLVF